jgi:hypothetical protein
MSRYSTYAKTGMKSSGACGGLRMLVDGTDERMDGS